MIVAGATDGPAPQDERERRDEQERRDERARPLPFARWSRVAPPRGSATRAGSARPKEHARLVRATPAPTVRGGAVPESTGTARLALRERALRERALRERALRERAIAGAGVAGAGIAGAGVAGVGVDAAVGPAATGPPSVSGPAGSPPGSGPTTRRGPVSAAPPLSEINCGAQASAAVEPDGGDAMVISDSRCRAARDGCRLGWRSSVMAAGSERGQQPLVQPEHADGDRDRPDDGERLQPVAELSGAGSDMRTRPVGEQHQRNS